MECNTGETSKRRRSPIWKVLFGHGLLMFIPRHSLSYIKTFHSTPLEKPLYISQSEECIEYQFLLNIPGMDPTFISSSRCREEQDGICASITSFITLGTVDIQHQPDFIFLSDGFNVVLEPFGTYDQSHHVLEWFETPCRKMLLASYDLSIKAISDVVSHLRFAEANASDNPNEQNRVVIELIKKFLVHYLTEPGHPHIPGRIVEALLGSDGEQSRDPQFLRARLFMKVPMAYVSCRVNAPLNIPEFSTACAHSGCVKALVTLIPEQFAAHLRIPTSILDFLLVTPTSTNINVAPQSDCVRTLYLKRPCTNIVPKQKSDANTHLEVAVAPSPEWDSLNLEYPPGVTDQIYTTTPPPFPEWDGLQLEYPPEVSHPGDQIKKANLNPALPPAPGHTGNAGDVVTPENNWTEAKTAVFGRADPADDEWTDEESNQTGITIPRSGRENPGVPQGKDSEWKALFIHRAQ
ncbi:hypothetical protein B0H13DRAFT_1854947 [Mycena leptocephala]|nr:hypothetical protein B0H13DRAFT_1854947 [Mycena leptocephala]